MRHLLSTSGTVTSGERDANQPQVRDQAEHAPSNATNRDKSGEAELCAGDRAGFGRELFAGRLRLDLLDPLPGRGTHRLDADSEAFLARLRTFCAEKVDSRLIEREARIPDEVITGLKDLGAFSVKLPREFGGLGLPGTCYHRALMTVSSTHPALGELLAAHQAIGLPQPVRLFGTEEQKRELLPRCVREISAFALTEPEVGNDPFRVRTTAVPHPDGSGYTLTGLKSWTTNGVLADLLVVLAEVPGRGLTAFVVEAGAEGVTVEHRGAFLGLRGLENGVIRLHEVTVPAGHRIGAEGEGLEVALAAQDTGRLSLPAVCAAAAKWSLKIAREWSRVRVQWGRPIGEHEAVAAKVSFIAATAFALEAMVEVSGRHADAGADIRVEAELAKLYASEQAWRVADELVQVRGGRGYETAESAAARGERGVPVEQLLRDLRVGRIFDSSSEVLRVFLAQEVLWPSGTGTDPGPDIAGATRVGAWYARGLLQLAVDRAGAGGFGEFGVLARHLRFVERAARRLAAQAARGRSRWGDAVEEHQLFVGRLVDVGAELYAMSAACVYARSRTDQAEPAAELADAFCRQAGRRVTELFDRLWHNTDEPDRAVAARVLDDRYTWLEDGVLDPSIEGPWIAEPTAGPAQRENLRREVA
ncbi:MAG TPA: acyl-CoA dehydrogenase family protein [Actinophytocola sp.]|nr:acyl-CoA dehydrogenase family protein [Actinophytocola sp.]